MTPTVNNPAWNACTGGGMDYDCGSVIKDRVSEGGDEGVRSPLRRDEDRRWTGACGERRDAGGTPGSWVRTSQPISAVRVRLDRSEEGLRLSFDGKLGEVGQKPSQALLGPEFHGEFLIPTAFLFARGIFLLGQWAERQRRLGKG